MLSVADLGSSALLKGVLECLDGQGDCGQDNGSLGGFGSQVDDGLMCHLNPISGMPSNSPKARSQ